ncbi:MAG: hypothetical protein KGH89_09435, partial [Thaumarchaeota archaeon]|nr:hypothetical protein [Nitrososphaerota archaeon]
ASFSPGSGGAAGTTGVGPSASSSATGQSSVGFGGVLAPELKIDNISYDVCQSNTVKVLVEYSDNNPSVILRTSLSGVVQTQLAKDQPFAQENVNSTIQKIVYEAPINPKEQSFEVVALQAVDNNVNSVGQTVDITGCQESLNFENGQQTAPSSEDESAPKIFDVKLESDNGTVISGNNYVDSQSVTVSAIISSTTPLDKAEIRFMNSGQSSMVAELKTMTVAPLLIS